MSSDDAKTRILNAAGPIFAEKGYNGASVREISEAAGVNQAAINYYFGGKEALYCEAFRVAHPLGHIEPGEFFQLWDEETAPEEKLRRIIRFTVELFLGGDEEDAWKGRLIMRQMTDPIDACQHMFFEFVQKHISNLRTVIAELLPPDAPEDLVLKLAFSVVGQCVHYRFGKPMIREVVSPETWDQHFQPEQVAEIVSSVVLGAIGAEQTIREKLAGQSLAIQEKSGTHSM